MRVKVFFSATCNVVLIVKPQGSGVWLINATCSEKEGGTDPGT